MKRRGFTPPAKAIPLYWLILELFGEKAMEGSAKVKYLYYVTMISKDEAIEFAQQVKEMTGDLGNPMLKNNHTIKHYPCNKCDARHCYQVYGLVDMSSDEFGIIAERIKKNILNKRRIR